LKALAVVEPLTTGKDRVQTKGVILYNLAMSYAGQGEPWRVKTVRLNYADFLRRTGRAKQADELESKSKRASGR
jgi:hypothetical protein